MTTSSPTARRGSFAALLAALACTLLLALPATSGAALPGKRVAVKTETDQAYLADVAIYSTSPNGCFETFRAYYPCLRIKRPNNVWVVGYYPPPIGWEFGEQPFPGWRILCGKGTRIAERTQSNRDGLEPDLYWIGQTILKLPIPIKKPSWCEVDVNTNSPSYSENWDTEQVVTSKVEIRATSRRR